MKSGSRAQAGIQRYASHGARAVLALLLLTVTGCPPADQKASSSSSSTRETGPQGCTKVGQTCEVSTGKLGTCVQKDDCKDPAGCFLCQSQH